MGKEATLKFLEFYNNLSDNFDEKANNLALQKKLELKDELSKELATKSDINKIESRIENIDFKIESVKKELKIYMQFLIVLIVIFIGLLNPIVTKLISNWLKLGL